MPKHLVHNALSRTTFCDCGVGQTGMYRVTATSDVDNIGFIKPKAKAGKQHLRIVNGYEPLFRPWMAYIQIRKVTDKNVCDILFYMLVFNVPTVKA